MNKSQSRQNTGTHCVHTQTMAVTHWKLPLGGDSFLHLLELFSVNEVAPVLVHQLERHLKLRCWLWGGREGEPKCRCVILVATAEN